MQITASKPLRVFLISLMIFFALVVAGLCYFIFAIRIATPEMKPDLLKGLTLQQINDSTFVLGENWLRKNQYGIWEIYVKGGAMERGYAYGKLAEELVQKQEAHFVEQVEKLVPNATYRWWLKWFVAWFDRDIDKYIPAEYQEEIFGVSLSADDKYNYIAPKYYRKISYHAAHDLGHALKDMKMVGCTSFSVNKEFSADSSLLIARNFDFYMGDGFAREKMLVMMRPDSGYAFVSYSWPGFMGVVSGMNERGLTVTINASRSDIPTKAKMPIALLAREIVQYASNIEEAVAIAKKREVFVSESILIGSAEDNKAVLIEKSPEKFGVYESNTNYLVCSNHYQSEPYAADSNNVQNIRGSDSQYRYKLMNELLANNFPVDVEDAAAILRNQKGLGGKDLGMGNSKAINQLIAHHGIIFKPEESQVWISANPYQCGVFAGYYLGGPFGADAPSVTVPWVAPEISISRDSFLLSDDYRHYQYFRKIKEHLFSATFLGTPFELSQAAEDSFIASNPKSYLTYASLADYYFDRENCEKATRYYEAALNHEPASKDEADGMREKINDCKKKQ